MAPLRRRLSATFVVLLALFLTNALIISAVARTRDQTRLIVQQRLNPAQIKVERLLTSLVSQESGERGYRLTLDPLFLRPYRDGIVAERRIIASLSRDLAGSSSAQAAVRGVEGAAATWRKDAEAEMAAGRAGDLSRTQIAATALTGETLFDDVRGRVAALTQQVSDLQSRAVSAQGADDAWFVRTVFATLASALVVVLVGLTLLRRSLSRPLDDLVASIEQVKAGDLARPVKGRGPQEFVQVGDAVDAMRTRMLRDATETLNRSLILVTEDQRRQLAADIHDDPTQALTAVILRLQRLRRRLTGTDAVMLADAETVAGEAVARLRRLIFELHSPTLEAEGLAAAIRVYMEETFDPARTRFDVLSSGDESLTGSVRALAYRLARGALLNAAKHADASRVTARLEHAQDKLTICIADDGRGFDPAATSTPKPGHLGLLVSEQFARAAGGGYCVESAPGWGTTITFWLPADNAEA